MHPSEDKDKGLRIEYTDTDSPILNGRVGVRTHNIGAWYDNMVVMPLKNKD